MLPGVAPTGKPVEMAVAVIVGFKGGKISHEHIYWDQAGVLAQVGLLNPTGLPVTGAESARKVLDPKLPPRRIQVMTLRRYLSLLWFGTTTMHFWISTASPTATAPANPTSKTIATALSASDNLSG